MQTHLPPGRQYHDQQRLVIATALDSIVSNVLRVTHGQALHSACPHRCHIQLNRQMRPSAMHCSWLPEACSIMRLTHCHMLRPSNTYLDATWRYVVTNPSRTMHGWKLDSLPVQAWSIVEVYEHPQLSTDRHTGSAGLRSACQYRFCTLTVAELQEDAVWPSVGRILNCMFGLLTSGAV